MLRYLNKFYNFNNYLIYFIILFFFWSSINTGSKYLLIELNRNTDFGIIINFARSIIPYFLIILFLFFFRPISKIFISFDLILKLFFIYGLLQLSGLFYIGENLYEHYWVVCLFSVLIFSNYVQNQDDEKLLNYILLINIIFTFFVFVVFLTLIFKTNLFSYNLLYSSYAFRFEYNFESMPRSSGISRMALILFIFFNSFYFFFNSKKIKIAIFIINILLVSIIFLMQSRGMILSFLISLILINLLFFFKDFKYRLTYIFLITLLPIFIFTIYPTFKNLLIEKYGEKIQSYENYNKLKFQNLELNIRSDLFNVVPDDTFENKIGRVTTNRYYAWDFLISVFFKKDLSNNIKKILNKESYDMSAFDFKEKYNYFTGFGPQADRHLLFNDSKLTSNKVIAPFGGHASNGYIYSLICSGFIGLITFFLLNLLIFYKILKLFFKNKLNYFSLKPFLSSSIIIVLFLQFRILFENSYSVFGVDMLLFFSSYLIIENEYKKLKN